MYYRVKYERNKFIVQYTSSGASFINIEVCDNELDANKSCKAHNDQLSLANGGNTYISDMLPPSAIKTPSQTEPLPWDITNVGPNISRFQRRFGFDPHFSGGSL